MLQVEREKLKIYNSGNAWRLHAVNSRFRNQALQRELRIVNFQETNYFHTMELLNFKTDWLIIRHLSINDLADFHICRSNPEVTRYQGFDVMNMEEAEAVIKENATKQ